MAKTRSAMRAILAPAARRDFKEILLWSESKFGKDAALRYQELLIQAVRDIEADPVRLGVSQRAELSSDVWLYHLAFSRDRSTGARVKEPRRLLVFRVRTSRLEIMLILHDSRDLALHTPAEPRNEVT